VPQLFTGRGEKLGEAIAGTVGDERTRSLTQPVTFGAQRVAAPAGLREFAHLEVSPFCPLAEGINEANKEACKECVKAGRHTLKFNTWLTETQSHTLEVVSHPGPKEGERDALWRFVQQLCSGNIPLGYAGDHHFLYDHLMREAERAAWSLKWHKGGGRYDCICLGCTACSALLRIETPFFGKNGRTMHSEGLRIQKHLLQFLFADTENLPPRVQESLKKSSCIVETMFPGSFVKVGVTGAGG